jgi:NAD-dependent DNA ligase
MFNIFSQFNAKSNYEKSVNELLGLCQGIIADGSVCEKEIVFLQKWFANHNSNVNYKSENFFNVISDKINEISQANNIEKQPLLVDFYSFLQKLTGSDYELGEVQKSTTLPVNDNAKIVIPESKFVLTGTFARLPRKQIAEIIEANKGYVKSNVTLDINFLVIGEYVSKDWINSSYGRKIERAVELKQQSHQIEIVSEAHFLNHIETASVA